uniref:uncharacterized protein n=1 Tax=Pristiophorus japonicus TaxID=55135 RepID=UPI00398E3FFD
MSMTLRTSAQLNKKWQDLRQAVTKMVPQINRERSQTGGGLPNRLQLTAVEQRIASMIKCHRRRLTINAEAGPSFPIKEVEHQEEIEGAPEVEGENVQENTMSDITTQDNDGQQEDVDDEMVTLDLEVLNPSRIPSPFMNESSERTFPGVTSEAAGTSVSQQATPVRRRRRANSRPDAETLDSENIGTSCGDERGEYRAISIAPRSLWWGEGRMGGCCHYRWKEFRDG